MTEFRSLGKSSFLSLSLFFSTLFLNETLRAGYLGARCLRSAGGGSWTLWTSEGLAGAGASGSVWSRCIGEGGREAPLPGHLCLSRAVSPLTWQPLLPIKAPKGGKEYVKAVYCHLAYQLLCRVHHLNAGLDEAQAGIKMAGRDTNNLRYADGTTFMAER